MLADWGKKQRGLKEDSISASQPTEIELKTL